jgi:branched-chain amino acid transport system permease protein
LQIVFNILISFALFLIIANSFSLIYTTAKFFHIAKAGIITVSPYFVFLFTNKFNLPFIVALIFAVSISIVLGLLCEVLLYKNMRKKQFSTLSYLIASIGVYTMLQNSISLFFGDDIKIINTAKVTIGHKVFGAYITTIQVITIFVSIALFMAVNLFLHYTTTGKSIRAVASNPELCNIYGISSNKIILIAFGIGSALAATAGILSAMDTNMTPTFGFNLLLYGVVAMIIGGVGSTRGLIAGTLLVATAQHLAAYYIDTKWMDAVTYIILILFLIWKPLGFSGKRLKKVEV